MSDIIGNTTSLPQYISGTTSVINGTTYNIPVFPGKTPRVIHVGGYSFNIKSLTNSEVNFRLQRNVNGEGWVDFPGAGAGFNFQAGELRRIALKFHIPYYDGIPASDLVSYRVTGTCNLESTVEIHFDNGVQSGIWKKQFNFEGDEPVVEISYWTSRVPAANLTWRKVIYGNGLFVAVASSGTGNRVMTSPDGINWTSRTSAADFDWYSLAYGNGLFVAVSNNGKVMTSPDGINWTNTADIDASNDVTYGNGLFISVSALSGKRIMTSPDGVNWTSRVPAANLTWRNVTYGNGLFVAVASSGTGNRVMTSPDGINWTSRTSAADLYWDSLAYGNGLFVAGSDASSGNNIMTSPDGINWTARQAGNYLYWYDITYSNGQFVAVAVDGTTQCSMTSTDGINWTTVETPAGLFLFGVCGDNNGLFVAVGDSGVITAES